MTGGKLTEWILGAMLAAVLAMTGYIAANMNDRLDGEANRINRANNRLNSVCERIAVVERQLFMQNGSCAQE